MAKSEPVTTISVANPATTPDNTATPDANAFELGFCVACSRLEFTVLTDGAMVSTIAPAPLPPTVPVDPNILPPTLNKISTDELMTPIAISFSHKLNSIYD